MNRLVALSLCAAVGLLACQPDSTRRTPPADTPAPSPRYQEPTFRRDGTLSFLSPGGVVKKVTEVEVADSESEYRTGLMYRTTMTDDQAMLFVFTSAQPRFFYMKNTSISLDIIFLSTDQRIVTIRENTTPFSEEQIPSDIPAHYTVEVPAGFALRYGIMPGDQVVWTIDR